jgi:hypothetical protein
VGANGAPTRAWTELSQTLTRVAWAVDHGERADGEVVLEIASRWTGGLAEALEKKPDAGFAGWVGDHIEATNDPRFERYWQLMAILKAV